ncbi:FERM and PDZ domain-containing protein 2 [Cyphomyrmex costatus]|uniref:FERM and PDZ domain-containing protein 2 n=1 Tax=Cyphomyrmex costatus TaxID=456900 RepID=A0A195CYC4_9HYME|nr:FERM and PDZ domain-containing protein 2 [Cyphomyrmex costatus]
MPTDVTGGPGLAVVAGDVLTLRGTGLAAAETWALLCQAAQALQDLFLSNGGVVGGSRAGPVVTPHTLELTLRGRVLLQLAPPETARAYLPPEYRPGRVYSDTDSEKMWMYSLGRALLDTTPRATALTGTVSVSPSSALQSVLAAMTEPDPRRRASLMNLLDVISEYCRTRLQARPFTHIVMEMYREVVRSPQYAARKRAMQLNALCPTRNMVEQLNQQKIYGHHHHPQQQQQDYVQVANGQPPSIQHQTRVGQYLPNQLALQQRQQQQHDHIQRQANQFRSLHQQQDYVQQPLKGQQDHRSYHYNHQHAKGTHFRAQSRNSQSHPNLTSLCDSQQQQQEQRQQQQQQQPQPYRDTALSAYRTHFQSQLDIQSGSRSIGPATTRRMHHHSRTYSQPVYTRLQHTRSSGNLPTTTSAMVDGNPDGNVYNDPIYALPVKPFLSSQDVRVNGLSAKSPAICHGDEVYGRSSSINRHPSNTGHSQPDITSQPNERLHEDIYGRTPSGRVLLQRQHSNPQLPNRMQTDEDFKRLSQPSVATTESRCVDITQKGQTIRQQSSATTMRLRGLQGPPKPPRIITTLRKTALSDSECNSHTEPPAKPPRIMVRNGPRARRGKAVQRAPSRLYRTVGGPTRCFNKAQCVGPEFVVRANQPPKTLCVGQVKAGNSGRIVVIMLTGQRVEVTCDPQKVTAGDLFQAIVQAESLDENFTLGLAVLLAGDFAMLPPDTKLNKVAPPGWLSSGKSKGLLGLPTSFMLYLRLRFFLPSLRGTRSWISKHLLYLQIRRCILEQQLVCPYSELINLTGLALQAEFGNYNANEHGCGDYFLLEHYVPESLILSADRHQSQPCVDADTLRAQLHRAHRDRRGLDSNNAEEMFITHAQSLPDYGSHYYIATVDSKELEKLMMRQRKGKSTVSDNRDAVSSHDGAGNAYRKEKSARDICSTYGRIGNPRLNSRENMPTIPYSDEHAKNADLCRDETCNSNNKSNNNNINSVNSNNSKNSKSGKKKTESNVWLAIHSQGLKLLERGGEPRERTELAHFQWRDVQTLSYSKSCLVVYSKLNGKRCKFKLRMDHRKSYFAFKLTSLHHQFFLRLRSELTSLQGLAKEFGVPLTEIKSTPLKPKSIDSKTKITIASAVKVQQRISYPMQLEEYQNKENENPQKDPIVVTTTKDAGREPAFYSSEEDALYAQVNVRLEPEGQSRDTEDESERGLTTPHKILLEPKETKPEHDKLYGCPGLDEAEIECTYSLPKVMSNNINQLDKPNNPEELYAAINKVRLSGKNEFPVPDEVWNVSDIKKTLQKMKASSLPNYGAPKQSSGLRTPSLPRRLGVKMGTRAIYSSLVQKDTALTDDTESLSLKSDTESSIQSLSARSTESPMPEAYVLNADVRTNDETFRIPDDESMSASLMARLEELSFAEERILHTIKLERGHGGSIGLQVMEGNDGGVYVQAVSVGGSADMAGNVNKGDRIVAINGQNLLNLRYEDALKMLQSSSETIELVLSQPAIRKSLESRNDQDQGSVENNYLHDIKFDVSSEAETSSMMNKWIVQKTTDVASVQNTSSAYSSAASSAMGNHNNTNSLYMTDLVDNNALKSASMLLSIEDFDVNNGNSTKPPVPPRRTKRKIKIAPIESSVANNGATETTNDIAISQQKRPPPQPPLLLEKCRRNNCGYVKTRQPQCDTSANCPRVDTKQHHRENRVAASRMIEVKHRDNTTSIEDNSTSSNSANNHPIPKSIVSKSSSHNVVLPKIDKYPPLFFTLHDFENVVSDTWNRNESVGPRNSQNLHEKESTKAHILDDGDDVCFRVTTTSLPFEKCLGKWRDPFDDDFSRKFDDYRFEDSTNENDKGANDKRSFDYNNVFDNNDESKYHVGTKVRFMIESPGSSRSKRDSNVKISVPCNSLRSHESILNNEQTGERSTVSSVKLTEIREEFADVKDCCDNARDKSYTSSVDKRNSATGEDDPFIMQVNEVDVKLKEIPQMYCNDRNNDVNCEKIREKDSDLIPRNVQASDEILKTKKKNIITGKIITSDVKQVDQSNTSSGIVENVRFIDNSLETACRIEKETKITHREEEMLSKKSSDDIKEKCVAKNEKFLSNESFQNECNDNGGSNRNISTDNLINKSDKIEQTRLLQKNKKKNNSSEDSKNNHDIFAKNVPVKVKQNSFLETMLSNDSTNISMNCAIISVTSNIDKELSTNKTSNKIRKLDVDFMTESERSRDLSNTTEINTKKQTILNNSKEIKEKIVKTSNIKSTQSENKSASDVKNDVLNELLCNFNNIKLKIVSPENKKFATKIGEKIPCPIAIDRKISKEKENASKSLEKSRNEVCSVLLNTKITNVDNDIKIVEKIIKEENSMKINIRKKPQNLKNDTPTISEKIIKNENIEIKNSNKSCDIKSEVAKDNAKMMIGKNSSDIKLEEEINVKMKIRQTSEDIKNAIEITNRELKKSRDIHASCKNSLENGRKHERASREIHTRSEEKTDEVIANDETDDDRSRITNRSALVLVEDTMNSGDKCAIARKTISVNPYNNNDNNRAVTPVANISNDQSFRDIVTITPGKVRSFVKYYEIRCDATTVEKHSKINDREKVARRKFMKSQAVPLATKNSQRPKGVIMKKKETKGGGKSVKSNDCDLPETSNKTQPSTFVPRVPENPFHNSTLKTIKIGSKMEKYEKSGSHMSDKETRAPFTKTAKKSVQFLGGFTVIHSETFGKDESAGITDSDTNALKKRKAPGIPSSQDSNNQKLVREIAKSEKPLNVGKGTLRPREAVTQIHVTDHVQNSGINRFVLKPETPQLVIYCTI